MKHKIHLYDLLQVLNLFIFIIIFFSSKIEELYESDRITLSNILCQTIKGINEIQIDAFRMTNHFE
jgi:hypothetical protein